jgi:membrane fusion protein, multidrug efflux system
VRSSVLIAALLALLLGVWLASGQLEIGSAGSPAGQQPDRAQPPTAAPAFRVAVRDSVALPVDRVIRVNGRTAPARRVDVRAEAQGRVLEILAERGAGVEAGEVVLRLDQRDRAAMLRMAEAVLVQREVEEEAARRLRERGFQAENEAVAAAARLEEARAAVETARLELARTEIRIPFDGVLERRPVEIGDYVDAGDTVATVIELDPLVVIGHVAEADMAGIRAGMPGEAVTVTGVELDGRLRYVAREADEATRTFRVELEAANPGNRAEAGISTEMRLPLEPLAAHRVAGSVLVLDEAGRLGVKLLDEASIVHFHPARIVRAEADSVWLGGLPERIRIVTVGQGFVRPGQLVEAVSEEALAADPAGAEDRG